MSRIIAFGRMTPKAVIRKVFNTFEHSMTLQSEITKLVPDLCKSLDDAYKHSPELLTYKEKYPTEWSVIERLENVMSHESQHAGGTLIYPDLGEHVPLKWDSENQIYVATWDKYMLEDLGHFKFDILGLESLPIVKNCVDSIERTTGKRINLHEIDKEDKRVYDMLSRGDVSGVFQIANQSGKVIEQQPRNFRDLIAINALIRPGTGDWEEYIARRGGKRWECHPDRLPYLQETEGLITYQEQFLLDCQTFAGWDIAYTDKKVRKNKDIRNDKKLESKFIIDAITRGYDEDVVLQVWDEICDAVAGGYSFNKSHSASYAMLSYQTAYLKCHYPEHFYASLMSGEKTDGDGQSAIAGFIAECKEKGITILPPDVNDSGADFTVTNRGIHYRITTIKHVGQSAIEHINELRPIVSFDDFLARRDKAKANKAVVINLVKAGAFDFDTPNRAELLWKFDMDGRTKTQIKNNVQTPRYEVDDLTYMEWEKEVLGMYLSQHPMEKYGFKRLDEYTDKGHCLTGGEVEEIYAFHPQKNPAKPKMAFVTLNTLYGKQKIVVFASHWAKSDVQEALTLGNIVLVRGTRSGNDVLLNSTEVLQHGKNIS